MTAFPDILGQDHCIDALRRAVAGGRLAGAYLFSGPAGVGKASTAVALARAINCTGVPGGDLEGGGCGECNACRKIDGGSHTDLERVERDGNFIKIDRIRALEQRVAFAPNEARRRVVIIDGAEFLNDNAANALLKSVEEPRRDTTFVLVTAAPQRVIPTLRSRCQLLRFGPLSREQVERVVRRHVERTGGPDGEQVDDEQILRAVAVAEGSPGRALALLGSEQLENARAIASAMLSAAGGASVVAAFEAAEKAGRDKPTLLEAIELLRAYHRDLMLVAEGVGPERLVYAAQHEALTAEAARTPRVTLMRRLRAIQEAQEALLGNVNPRLTLEQLCLAMGAAGGS